MGAGLPSLCQAYRSHGPPVPPLRSRRGGQGVRLTTLYETRFSLLQSLASLPSSHPSPSSPRPTHHHYLNPPYPIPPTKSTRGLGTLPSSATAPLINATGPTKVCRLRSIGRESIARHAASGFICTQSVRMPT